MEVKRRDRKPAEAADSSAAPDRSARGSGPGKRSSGEPRKDMTLRLDASLGRRLKVFAAMEERTVNDLITEAIEKHVVPQMDKRGV